MVETMARKEEIRKEKIESTILNNVPTTAVEMFRQPWNLTVLKGEMTRSQVNMLIELVGQLQERIKEKIEERKQSLFGDDDFDNGRMAVDVPLSSITKDACKYEDIEPIAKRLFDLQTMVQEEEDGKLYDVWVHVFDRVWIPKEKVSWTKSGEKRKGFLRFEFSQKNTKEVFSLSRYTKYIKSVAKGSKSLFTSRLYMMVSAYKDIGRWVVAYDELHRIFGFSTYDTKTGKWEVVKYPEYRKFRQRVLQPAYEELKALAENGETNLCFEYEEIYPSGKGSGKPDKIKFIIHSTGYGKSQEELSEYERKKNEVEQKCREWFDFKTNDCELLFRLVTVDNVDFLLMKIEKVKEHLDGKRGDVKNVQGYVFKVLRDELMALVPEAEEITEVQGAGSKEQGKVQEVWSAERVKDDWLRMVGMKDYKMWLTDVDVRMENGKVVAVVRHEEGKEWMEKVGKEKLGVEEVRVES